MIFYFIFFLLKSSYYVETFGFGLLILFIKAPPPKPTVFLPSGIKWAQSEHVTSVLDGMNISPFYRDLLHPRLHPLGGASSLHAYWNDVEKASRVTPGFDIGTTGVLNYFEYFDKSTLFRG